VLLIDGPVVLGWGKWREIDARYFGGTMQGPAKTTLRGRASLREIAAIRHLLAGAVAEAALVCATSDHRLRDARDLTSPLRKMLTQFIQGGTACTSASIRRRRGSLRRSTNQSFLDGLDNVPQRTFGPLRAKLLCLEQSGTRFHSPLLEPC